MIHEDDRRIGGRSALVPRLTHTLAGNSSFYAAVPDPYKDYYQRFVRNYFHWYDGYVPVFHNHHSGIFSTRIAYTILHKLSNQITGGKILFDDEGKEHTIVRPYMGEECNSLEFAEKWSKHTNLSSKVTQLVEWSLAGGDALLKLDQRNAELQVNVLRKDNYFVSTNFNGDIEKASILLYNYTEMAKQDDGSTRYFYLLEERAYKNGQPSERLTIKEGTGDRITYKNVDFHSADVEFTSLPRNIRERLTKEFPNVTFGEWYSLPFTDLGVYLAKASEKISFAPALPGGESLLSNMIAELMSYDFYFSAFNTDMYMGRGKVLMPRHMQSPNLRDGGYGTGDSFQGLDEFLLQRIDYVNPDNQNPLPLQFDLRAMEWKEVRNTLLQLMATKIGISERTIATYLVPASEKPTAYEISSDENSTANFVESKRPFITNILDKLFREVSRYYGYGDDYVLTKFSRIGLSNFNNVVNQITILKQNGLIDEMTALEKLYPDFTQKQLIMMQQRLREEREQSAREAKPLNTDVIEAHEDIVRSGINTTPKPNDG